MFTAELLGMMIAWLLAAILLSLFLWMLVLIWGQIISAMKVLFGLPGMSREPPNHAHEHDQMSGYPPVSHHGYERRDYQ